MEFTPRKYGLDFKNLIKNWFGPKCMCNLHSFNDE